jgi:hypothetical protein
VGSEMKKKEGLKERFYKFALRIIKFVKGLPKEMAAYEIGKQLLRSGTSIAANYEEATGAFSKEDFTYKISIAFKEAKRSFGADLKITPPLCKGRLGGVELILYLP